ncbi:MAG: hypothetical protein J0L81_07195 [Caulobacterales bacterium]|nr:hypothetical protein [Caulobacterales bacterium]
MDADIFVPFVFFGFLGAIILVPIWLKERTKQSAHQLIAQALDKGQPLDPALLRQLTEPAKKPQDKARNSLGSGVVLMGLALGFVGAGFAVQQISGAEEALGGMLVPAAILGSLGFAFLLLALVDYATKKKDQ